jgi:hypothetical protein
MMAASSCAALVVCVTILVAATTRAPDIATIAGMRQRALWGGDVVGVDLAPQRAYEMLRSGQSESRGWDLKTQPATRSCSYCSWSQAGTSRCYGSLPLGGL